MRVAAHVMISRHNRAFIHVIAGGNVACSFSSGLVAPSCVDPDPAARADSVEEVRALNRRAAELYGKGEYAEAFSVGERALSLAEKTLGAEQSLHAYKR